MKKIFILSLITLSSAFGQSIVISPSDGNTGNINVNSTNGGLLIPRLTETQRAAITNPAQGLMVYQTDGSAGFFVNKSQIPAIPNWVKITEGDNLWTKNILNINDIYSINTGNVGIGTNIPTSKFDISANGTTSAIRASQTGASGNAASFSISNASSASSALFVQTNGTGNTISANNTGTGKVALFSVTNSANTGEVLQINNAGSGKGLYVYSYGLGTPANFQINNLSNSSNSLSSTTNGTGKAANFQISNTANASDALSSITNGTGNAGYFQINNATNNAYAIHATTNGTESAGLFETTNTLNVRPAIYAGTSGSGIGVVGSSTSGAGGYFTSTSGLALRTGTGNVAIGASTAPDKLTVTTLPSNYGISHTDGTVTLSTLLTSATPGASIGTKSNHSLNFFTNSSASQVTLTTSGILGIGNVTPIKAGLIVNKKVGAANAIFGDNTTGVSIESSHPGISFNGYFSTARRALVDGYVGGFSLNPTTGLMSYYNTSTSNLASTLSISTFDRFTIDKLGNVSIGSGNLSIGVSNPTGTLEVKRGTGLNGTATLYGTTHASIFNYSTDENTYIRGGKIGSNVLINDVVGLGNVGIGTNNPTYKLDIMKSGYGLSHTDGTIRLATFLGANAGWLGTMTNHPLSFFVNDGNAPAMQITTANQIQVGTTTTPVGFKMSVDGKLICTEIEVLVTPWPDYVFKPSYKLKPLNEVERFIKQNGHLPNIPKAQEIENKSLPLGNMSKLQMEKIEELTLYLIEINKRLKKVEDENEQLKKVINTLKSQN